MSDFLSDKEPANERTNEWEWCNFQLNPNPQRVMYMLKLIQTENYVKIIAFSTLLPFPSFSHDNDASRPSTMCHNTFSFHSTTFFNVPENVWMCSNGLRSDSVENERVSE